MLLYVPHDLAAKMEGEKGLFSVGFSSIHILQDQNDSGLSWCRYGLFFNGNCR